MSDKEKCWIIFYLSWSGVECTFEYDDEERHNVARAFLDTRLAALPMFRNGEPVLRTAYYYVEDDQRTVFEEFVRSGARKS